jgi:hypothetical protein
MGGSSIEPADGGHGAGHLVALDEPRWVRRSVRGQSRAGLSARQTGPMQLTETDLLAYAGKTVFARGEDYVR